MFIDTLSKGIEPLTSRLTVVCSNQLSYESKWSNYYKANSFLKAPTEIRTRVSGFKVLSDNHYTIRA